MLSEHQTLYTVCFHLCEILEKAELRVWLGEVNNDQTLFRMQDLYILVSWQLHNFPNSLNCALKMDEFDGIQIIPFKKKIPRG